MEKISTNGSAKKAKSPMNDIIEKIQNDYSVTQTDIARLIEVSPTALTNWKTESFKGTTWIESRIKILYWNMGEEVKNLDDFVGNVCELWGIKDKEDESNIIKEFLKSVGVLGISLYKSF